MCYPHHSMVEIRYYVTAGGREPFAEWFAELDPVASAKIARAIARMEQGNFSNVKSVGEGVLEYKIGFGPGYRIYFGRDGDRCAPDLAFGKSEIFLFLGLDTNSAKPK